MQVTISGLNYAFRLQPCFPKQLTINSCKAFRYKQAWRMCALTKVFGEYWTADDGYASKKHNRFYLSLTSEQVVKPRQVSQAIDKGVRLGCGSPHAISIPFRQQVKSCFLDHPSCLTSDSRNLKWGILAKKNIICNCFSSINQFFVGGACHEAQWDKSVIRLRHWRWCDKCLRHWNPSTYIGVWWRTFN